MRIWEIAKPLCIKGKALALQGYAKGNELMDKVAFLQKPLHKKIVWGVIGLMLLWIVFPSGDNDSIGTKHSATGWISKSKNELYVEGTNVCKVTSMFDNAYKRQEESVTVSYREVEPNLMPIPNIEVLADEIIKPTLSINKGQTYRDEGKGMMKVMHVGDGSVIATPDYRPNYCKHICDVFIVTDDEYVEGQMLKKGLYQCTGRKKVPLANGASMTMVAFKKCNDKKYDEIENAEEYNDKATVAAEKENKNRYRKASRECDQKRDEARRASEKEAINAARTELDPLFVATTKKYMEPFPMDRLHVAPDIKAFAKKVSVVPCFSAVGKNYIAITMKELEDQGCLCYYKEEKRLINIWGELKMKGAKSIIDDIFREAGYGIKILWNNEANRCPPYKVYVITTDGKHSNGKPKYRGELLLDYSSSEPRRALDPDKDLAIYVFDGDKNSHLREIWGNSHFLGGEVQEERALKFARAFKEMYESAPNKHGSN